MGTRTGLPEGIYQDSNPGGPAPQAQLGPTYCPSFKWLCLASKLRKWGFTLIHINVPIHTLDPITPHNSMEAAPEMLTGARKG